MYLSGGIQGLSDEECFGWRNRAKELLAGKYLCLDPTIRDWRGRTDLTDEEVDQIVLKDL